MSGPASWQSHCGDLWRAHVLATTGRDVCAIVGPSPRSRREWIATLRRLGVCDLAGVVSAVHGASLPIAAARRGDVVQAGFALGIARGELAEFFGGAMLPIGDVDRAWRVDDWTGGAADG